MFSARVPQREFLGNMQRIRPQRILLAIAKAVAIRVIESRIRPQRALERRRQAIAIGIIRAGDTGESDHAVKLLPRPRASERAAVKPRLPRHRSKRDPSHRHPRSGGHRRRAIEPEGSGGPRVLHGDGDLCARLREAGDFELLRVSRRGWRAQR